jgi:hypothetical protein
LRVSSREETALDRVADLADERLEEPRLERQVFPVSRDLPVAGDDHCSVERRQPAVGRDPVGHIGAVRIRNGRDDQIAACDDPFLREVDDQVAARVAGAEMEKPDFAAPAVKRERGVESHVGNDRIQRRQLRDLDSVSARQ